MHSDSVLLPEMLGNRLILCLELFLSMHMALPLLMWLNVLVVPILVLEQLDVEVVGVGCPIVPPVNVVGEGVRGPGVDVGAGVGAGAAVRLAGLAAPLDTAVALLVTVSLPQVRRQLPVGEKLERTPL